MRAIKVLILRWKELSLKDFISYLKCTFYLNEPYLVYRCYLSSVDKYEVKQIEGIQIKKGNIEELNQSIAKMKDCPWEFRRHLHDNVTEFFVAKDSSGIQHISWIYSKGDHNRLLTLGATDIEITHCYTSPTVRGKGIYPNVINTIKNEMKNNNIKRAFMNVHPDNTASIKGIEKADFHLAGKVRFIKVFGIRCSPRLDTNKIV